MKTKNAAVVVGVFADAESYHVEVENKTEELDDKEIAEILRELADELAPHNEAENRAKGTWGA